MIRKMTAGFNSLMKKYTPDPYVYALLLTLLVFILGLAVAHKNVFELSLIWGKGFWSLSTFTLQMTMILLLGYVVALSPPIKRSLSVLAGLPKNLPAGCSLRNSRFALWCFAQLGFWAHHICTLLQRTRQKISRPQICSIGCLQLLRFFGVARWPFWLCASSGVYPWQF